MSLENKTVSIMGSSLQAGHPFQQRCAHFAYSHARLQLESPVFLLLLDCVWQLLHQFPLALGFSQALLLRLATEAYASNYGTFLCNSHQERSVVPLRATGHFEFKGWHRNPNSFIFSHTFLTFHLFLPCQVFSRSDGEHSLFVLGPFEARGERLLL